MLLHLFFDHHELLPLLQGPTRERGAGNQRRNSATDRGEELQERDKRAAGMNAPGKKILPKMCHGVPEKYRA